ncbi:hypothetical protein [Membranihabitans maritimus]|uniref:hypothetical protein n=1 Tax=Membranihabitans maritimus TaxID=2904244 RepID=UPI001F3F459A|nr:hypothetical protein [Membranihabitans maritimus]
MKYLMFQFIVFCLASGCNSQFKSNFSPPSSFNEYWYKGTAEISSYELNQVRYGHQRKGDAILIYVTEPFSPTQYVKTENPTPQDISVLKLNFTKKFNTGIYPYSMMTSTFLPVRHPNHSIKVTSSSQEWCGHTYMELLNKNRFEVEIKSYFEGESNHLEIQKTWLEDDFWSMIRISPDLLPETGEHKIIPGFFYLRLKHTKTKAYTCIVSKSTQTDTTTLSLTYPDLDRNLSITFSTAFPHKILQWEETYPESGQLMSSTGRVKKTLKIPYWEKNSPEDSHLRDSLQLSLF